MSEEVTIPIEEYNHLLRCEDYITNWSREVVTCKRCGAYNPRGYLCAICDWNNSEDPTPEDIKEWNNEN